MISFFVQHSHTDDPLLITTFVYLVSIIFIHRSDANVTRKTSSVDLYAPFRATPNNVHFSTVLLVSEHELRAFEERIYISVSCRSKCGETVILLKENDFYRNYACLSFRRVLNLDFNSFESREGV